MTNERIPLLAKMVPSLAADPNRSRGRFALPCLPPTIESVLFDVEGVLYDDSVWWRWLLQLLARLGLHTHYTLFHCVWEQDYQKVGLGHPEFWDALRGYLRSLGLSPAQVEEVLAASRPQYRVFEQSLRPFPSLRPSLGQLTSKGVPLSVACSTPLSDSILQSRLARLRLERVFQGRCSRGVSRVADREEILTAALATTGACAERAVYVGRRRDELKAARDMGIYTVAFNPEPDASADAILDHYGHLPRLLDHTHLLS